MTVSNKQSKKRAGSREGKKNARGKTTTKLLVAMTGKASPAKAATGDEPVFAYIASLPQPQRGIAERIDALAAEQLSDLRRAVKWVWRTTVSREAGASRPAPSSAMCN
jgi:hypothetical protein